MRIIRIDDMSIDIIHTGYVLLFSNRIHSIQIARAVLECKDAGLFVSRHSIILSRSTQNSHTN